MPPAQIARAEPAQVSRRHGISRRLRIVAWLPHGDLVAFSARAGRIWAGDILDADPRLTLPIAPSRQAVSARGLAARCPACRSLSSTRSCVYFCNGSHAPARCRRRDVTRHATPGNVTGTSNCTGQRIYWRQLRHRFRMSVSPATGSQAPGEPQDSPWFFRSLAVTDSEAFSPQRCDRAQWPGGSAARSPRRARHGCDNQRI